MSRLLVTGGAGFIGSAVVAGLLEAGHEVRILDALREDVHRAPPATDPRAQLITGDVRDPELLDAALDGVDAVLHQAAKVGMGVDLQDAPDYAASNVTATAALLAGMARARVSALVLASSMVVYGDGSYISSRGPVRPAPRRIGDLEAGVFDPRDPETGEELSPVRIDEDARPDPRSIYAVTKLSQEQLAAVWARESGGRVAQLRYHNVYGPGLPRDTPYAGVAALFRSALERGEAPRVFEDGAQRRDFVHVRDVAGANLAALGWVSAAAPGTARTFNVASGTVTTILEIARGLSAVMGGPEPVVTGEYRAGDVRHIVASPERAATELGWRAEVPLQDGLAEFAVTG